MQERITQLEAELSEAKKALDIACQTHFLREKSLEKRLQLMGEKSGELRRALQGETVYKNICVPPSVLSCEEIFNFLMNQEKLKDIKTYDLEELSKAIHARLMEKRKA